MMEVIEALPRHLLSLRRNLREGDICEIKKYGDTIRMALCNTYSNSIIKKSLIIDGNVAAMYGCCGIILGQVGTPWLFTTPLIEKYYPYLASLYRREVRKMLEIFPVLENHVDAEYIGAVKLLELAGFTLYDAEPIGHNRAMFRKFQMVAHV